MGTTEYLAVVGGRIAYDDTGGTRPPVVMLPGMGDRRGAYRHLAPLLVEAGHRVVTMDLRGLGDSSVPWNDYSQPAVGLDVVALLRQLDAGPAVLVGHSYAAGAVVWAAANAPTRVAGIVLLCGFFRDVPLPWYARPAAWLMARSSRAWSLHYAYAHRTARPADLAAWRAGLVQMLHEPDRKAAMAGMLRGPKPEGERWAPSVNCPALVVAGGKDPDFPDPVQEAAEQRRLLRADLTVLDGAGHYPHSECPDELAAVMLPFLKQTLGPMNAPPTAASPPFASRRTRQEERP